MPDATYYYSRAAQRVVDVATPNGHGAYSRKTRDELHALHPDLQSGSAEEVTRTLEDTFLEGPRQISKDDFEQAYGALPPLHSRRTTKAHSFMLSEMYYGSVTRIYVRLAESGTCWTLRDRIDATHEDLVRRCEHALSESAPADASTTNTNG